MLATVTILLLIRLGFSYDSLRRRMLLDFASRLLAYTFIIHISVGMKHVSCLSKHAIDEK